MIKNEKPESAKQMTDPRGEPHTITIVLYDDVWNKLQKLRLDKYDNAAQTSTLVAHLVRRQLDSMTL